MSVIAGLLDTNILIDIFRGYAPTLDWMQNNRSLNLGVPSLVRMEIVLGTRDKAEQDRVLKLLGPFPVIHLSEIDSRWAMQQFEIFYLSHQIEIIDCFIAAMSVRLDVPLYTRNVRDVRILPDIRLVTPY